MRQPLALLNNSTPLEQSNGSSDSLGHVVVLGAGSWGSALAMLLARNGNDTTLWGRNASQIDEMKKTGLNLRYLPESPLPESLKLTSDLESSAQSADTLLFVTPSSVMPPLLKSLKDVLKKSVRIAWACKGFEPGTSKFMHQLAEEILDPSIALAILTGPSFAKEVAENSPTAVTIASKNDVFASDLVNRFHCQNFRAYSSNDVLGAELGGAMKNVFALATGMADGMRLGDNTRAALITRGLAEMMRLGLALGAKAETFMGLSGVGDLTLTCTGDLSRNRRLGLALGAGVSLESAIREIGQTVEGVQAARESVRLGRKYQVDLPISEQVYEVLHRGVRPKDAVETLLSRSAKVES